MCGKMLMLDTMSMKCLLTRCLLSKIDGSCCTPDQRDQLISIELFETINLNEVDVK